MKRAVTLGLTVVAGGAGTYLGLVTGAVPLDLGLGRRIRTLGPQVLDVAAPRELVFDILRSPYGERTTRAMSRKVQVLERGGDMVLAAHRTPLAGGLVATTVETVRFTPPERIDFRLVRGPVPHVTETFLLEERAGGTRLRYQGELATDLWGLGERWGETVARTWEQTVSSALADTQHEAQRRAGHRR